MATAHSTSKGRLSRNRPLKSAAGKARPGRPFKRIRKKSEAPDRGDAIRIRGRLREFLNAEQGFLLRVESLLLCIAQSMDDSVHPSTGPYYPDVVELASELLKRRAWTFDQLLLDGRLPEEPGP
jgi:hypothetical protein